MLRLCGMPDNLKGQAWFHNLPPKWFQPVLLPPGETAVSTASGISALDHFFIAIPRVAHSFRQIKDGSSYSFSFLKRYKAPDPSLSASAAWTSHILEKDFKPAFYLQSGVDFALASTWRYGASCPVSTDGSVRVVQLTTYSNGTSRPVTSSLPLRRMQAAQQDKSRLEQATSAFEMTRLSGAFRPFSMQCPPSFIAGDYILCPWYADGCGTAWHRTMLSLSNRTRHILRDEVKAEASKEKLEGETYIQWRLNKYDWKKTKLRKKAG